MIVQDFIRSPYKFIFVISVFGLFSSTFVMYLLSSIWLKKCHFNKVKCSEDYKSIYCNDDFKHFWEHNNTSLYFIFVFGIIQILIVISMVITALSCWKGQFLYKLLGKADVRYTLILVESMLFLIVILVETFTFLDKDIPEEHKTLKISSLVFTGLQGLFFMIFIITLICVILCKSNKEITESLHPILIGGDKDF